ncbi:pirin family protein [Streptomyces sp. NPDC094149]|uniref:pirin family protein n=1 Tax=Streptomyces sp. NPDC094149 TaxID=3155079 RepID=UPI0033187DA6
MPAQSADNWLALPKVSRPLATTDRQVLSITTAVDGVEGEGFLVRRAFAGIHHHQLDPLIMMDHIGEVEYGPGEPKGTPWHPHRGFETVTYVIDGEIVHRDSTGGGGTIKNGDTQWMTAGSGLLHIETPPESLVMSGGLFHGVQLWVNLPAADKMIAPHYQDIRGSRVRLLSSPDGGALLRVIAGELDGHRGPGATHTPITMVHATLRPGAQLTVPWREDFNAVAYVLAGRGNAGAEQRPIRMGQAALFGSGGAVTFKASTTQDTRTPDLEVLLLGGKPLREPIAQYGPFVMNTQAELIQAIEDYKRGRLGTVPVTKAAPGQTAPATEAQREHHMPK